MLHTKCVRRGGDAALFFRFLNTSGWPNVNNNFDEDRISFLKFEITTNLIILISTAFREKSFLFKKNIRQENQG